MLRRRMLLALLPLPLLGADWPRFLGSDGLGHSEAIKLTDREKLEPNIRWKVSLPGKGWASPVVVGDKI